MGPWWPAILREADRRRGSHLEDHLPPESSIEAEEVDILGAAGEYLFALFMGIELPSPRSGPDPGWDFVIDGRRIDVKSREYLRPDIYLLVPKKEDLRADAYVLAQIDLREWGGRLLGWATRAEVARAQVKSFGYEGYEARTIAAPTLRSLEELWPRAAAE